MKKIISLWTYIKDKQLWFYFITQIFEELQISVHFLFFVFFCCCCFKSIFIYKNGTWSSENSNIPVCIIKCLLILSSTLMQFQAPNVTKVHQSLYFSHKCVKVNKSGNIKNNLLILYVQIKLQKKCWVSLKLYLGFSVIYYGKTWMNFLTNTIFYQNW